MKLLNTGAVILIPNFRGFIMGSSVTTRRKDTSKKVGTWYVVLLAQGHLTHSYTPKALGFFENSTIGGDKGEGVSGAMIMNHITSNLQHLVGMVERTVFLSESQVNLPISSPFQKFPLHRGRFFAKWVELHKKVLLSGPKKTG